MKDQHKMVKSYRDLSQEELDQVKRIKISADELKELLEELYGKDSLNQRWMSIGVSRLHQGILDMLKSAGTPRSF